MLSTWVLVADTSRAKFFSVEKNGALSELLSLEHPEGRQHITDLTSDLPGRSFDSSKSGGRHALETKLSPKQQGAINFSKLICDKLESCHSKGEFDKLIITAPPVFLGLLRKKMGSNITRIISTEIAKNFIDLSDKEIRQHLPDRI